jgi:Fungal specific transcription factor domain
MAVTLRYIPAGHELLRALPPDTEELSKHFYNLMRLALQRKQTEKRAYTLELVELLLIQGHYLMLSKTDNEETWRVKGELVAIATAMGLHRDPGKDMLLEVAERRRWAWWNVVIIERYVPGEYIQFPRLLIVVDLLQLASIYIRTPYRNRITPF